MESTLSPKIGTKCYLLMYYNDFDLFWADFGHFGIPMVPEYFPHSYLLLKYVNIIMYLTFYTHFGVRVLFRISFYSILPKFGPFWAIFWVPRVPKNFPHNYPDL